MQDAQKASAVFGDGRFGLAGTPGNSVSWLRAWRWLLLTATILIGGAIIAFNVDCSVAQWFKLGQGPRYLHDLAAISELFGRSECVLLVAILIWRLDRGRLWAIPGLAATALLSGLAADGVKMVIARARPHHFDFLGSVWSSFGPWLPLGSLGSPNQSFPSAHTATAMGLAIALMVLYPAARGLFCLCRRWWPISGWTAVRTSSATCCAGRRWAASSPRPPSGCVGWTGSSANSSGETLHGRPRGCGRGTNESDTRNSKYETNPKHQWINLRVRVGYSDFGFGSCFGFRIRDLANSNSVAVN